MVCTEVVCEWFKKLNPHTRIDIMCGLLHMCVPPELRFLGTFLENLGKKDYHKLRDAEIKANNHIDLAKNTNASINNTTSNDSSTSSGSSTATGAGGSCNSSSSSSSNIMSEESLRNKLSLSLALLYSSNQQCSNILFKLLEANVSRALQVMPSMAVVTIYEILTILVMAANHPAFTFFQRRTMAELYKSAEKAAEGLIPKWNDRTPASSPYFITNLPSQDKCLCCHNCTSSPSPPKPGTGPYCCSRCVANTSPTHKDKAHVTKINVKGTRKLVDKPREFILQVTWSNGEVTEVYKTFHEVQEFSSKFVRMFEDMNLHKERKIPSLQGQYREEILEDVHFQSICHYTGQLEKLPQRFLECDHLVNFFTASESSRSSPSRSTNFTPNNEQPVISQCHQKSFNTASPSGDITNRQPHHSQFYTPTHYSQLPSNSHNTCSNRSVVTPQMNQGTSPNYSPTSSPPPQAALSSRTSPLQQSNSRSASPGSVDGNCLVNKLKSTELVDHLLKVDEEKIHITDNHKNGRDKRPPNGIIDYTGGSAGVNIPHHDLTWQQHPATAALKTQYSIPFANMAPAPPGQQQQGGPPSRVGMAPSSLPLGTVFCCYSQNPAGTPGPPNNADSSPGGSDYCSQPPSPGPPTNANVAMVAASSSSVASDDSDRVKNGKDGDLSLEQDFRKKESQKANLKLSQQIGSKTSVMRCQPEEQSKSGNLHLPMPHHYVDLQQQLPMGSYGAAPDLLPRQQMIPSRSAYNAQPAHTNIGIHPKNMINMPLDGKSSSPMVPLYPGLHNSVDSNTKVVSVMVNSNTAGPGDNTVGSGGPLFSSHLTSSGVRTRTAAVHQSCTRTAPSAVCTSNAMASTCSSSSSSPPRHNVKNGNGPLCPNSVVSQSLLPPGDPCSISVLSCSSDQTGGQPPPPMNYHGQCTNQSSVTTTTITYSSQAYSMSSPSSSAMGRPRRCNSCGCEGHCTSGSYHFVSMLTSPMTAPANTPPPHQWQHLSYMFPNANGMIPIPNLTPYMPNGPNPDLLYGNHPNVGLVHLNSSSQVTAPPPPPPSSSAPNPHYVLNAVCSYGLGNGGPHPPPHQQQQQQQHPLMAHLPHHTMTTAVKHNKPSIQTCYNCGGSNHLAVDCKESTMESMTGQYHLNYEDKAVAE